MCPDPNAQPVLADGTSASGCALCAIGCAEHGDRFGRALHVGEAVGLGHRNRQFCTGTPSVARFPLHLVNTEKKINLIKIN